MRSYRYSGGKLHYVARKTRPVNLLFLRVARACFESKACTRARQALFAGQNLPALEMGTSNSCSLVSPFPDLYPTFHALYK